MNTHKGLTGKMYIPDTCEDKYNLKMEKSLPFISLWTEIGKTSHFWKEDHIDGKPLRVYAESC